MYLGVITQNIGPFRPGVCFNILFWEREISLTFLACVFWPRYDREFKGFADGNNNRTRTSLCPLYRTIYTSLWLKKKTRKRKQSNEQMNKQINTWTTTSSVFFFLFFLAEENGLNFNTGVWMIPWMYHWSWCILAEHMLLTRTFNIWLFSTVCVVYIVFAVGKIMHFEICFGRIIM